MYGTVPGFDAYCADNGYDVSAFSVTAKSGALARSYVFVDGLGYRETGYTRSSFWPGMPSVAGQAREWPRSGASDIYGNELDSDAIPQRIEHASYEVAFFVLSGGEINRAISADQIVIREKVDVVDVQYANVEGMVDTRPMLPVVGDLLAPLMTGGSNPYGITGIVA